MRTNRLLLIMSIAVLCADPSSAGVASGSEPQTILVREDFESGMDERWTERGFPSIARRNSFSRAAELDGNHYLRVESSRSSSGKGIRIAFSPTRCPDMSWRWRISDVIGSADLSRQDRDDSAAKVYVVFDGPSWWDPTDKRILVYVWDNKTPVGTVLPNAWLPDKERMLVLESGHHQVGKWIAERVDLAADHGRAFPGEAPGEVEGIAFLADTDNTADEVSAGFDDLVVRCKGK